MPIRMPLSHIKVLGSNFPLWLLVPASSESRTWEPVVMTQVVRLLPPMLDTWIEFLVPGFGPSHLGSESLDGSSVSQINNKK